MVVTLEISVKFWNMSSSRENLLVTDSYSFFYTQQLNVLFLYGISSIVFYAIYVILINFVRMRIV